MSNNDELCYPKADDALTVKILDLVQQAHHYRQYVLEESPLESTAVNENLDLRRERMSARRL
jgi:hypothetical protein